MDLAEFIPSLMTALGFIAGLLLVLIASHGMRNAT